MHCMIEEERLRYHLWLTQVLVLCLRQLSCIRESEYPVDNLLESK